MQDLDLSGRELGVLRDLMAAEPVPGRPLPGADVLERLHALVPCDLLLTSYSDLSGLVTSGVEVSPSGRGRSRVVIDLDLHEQHGGPFYLGVMHWRLHPARAESCGVVMGPREDALAVGFRNGADHVVQYGFIREDGHFTPRELAILDLLGPVMQRLARERPTPALPATLTITERRMLCEVAAGLSNAEMAEGNCIAVGTVRKHLENSYRKLGVTSRLAAVARLRGSDEPGLDLRERVDRYA
jgi:DNA-binding CsgD family transcriptional regulator